MRGGIVATTLQQRKNPLKDDALTADDIRPGMQIKYWVPGDTSSVRHLTLLSEAYVDEDGDLVIDVEHSDGHPSTELTSTVGLSGDRYTGTWRIIAIEDDEE